MSRAFGRRVSVGELISTSGMQERRARELLVSLLGQGVFTPVDRRGPAVATPAANDPYAGFIFPAGAIDEPVELSEDQKKRILFVEGNIGDWSHYKLLAIKRTAAQGDIKQAYFRASKEFHPDAFFRRNLGTYKERIDRIFRAMKSAYDVLSDPRKREGYDATLIGELTPEEEAEINRRVEAKRQAQFDADRDKRHEARIAENRLKRNPMVERLKKAQDFMAMAEKALAEKRFPDAERHARLAVEYSPYDQGLKDRTTAILKLGAQDRARALVKRLNTNLSMVDAETLAKVGDDLADLAHGDAAILLDAAKALLNAQKPAAALRLAHDACEAAPRNVEAWRVLAESSAADEKWATALRAAERWSTLAPNDSAAKDLLKRAKKKSK